MNSIICYINNNYIDINKNNKIKHITLNCIRNEDIVDSKQFINEIKKYNIFSNIVSNKVEIYLNHKIKEKDLFYYKNIFEELNCYNIIINDTSKKLISPTLINNTEYYILFYNNEYLIIKPDNLPYFLNYYNIKKIKIISNNKEIPKTNTKYYFYNNPTTYFIS